MIRRRPSKQITIGNVTVGGDAPIRVQSMTSTNTADVAATVKQIKELEEADCELVRVAVPDLEAARALAEIKKATSIPIIADIHFDYRLALEALKAGADGLRLNPGNIREPERIKAVVKAAKERQVPIRVGVNAGSLPPAEEDKPLVERMIRAALWEIDLLEAQDFGLIKVSLKAFDVPTTVEAYRAIASRIPYPLHLGITEAGPFRSGVVRSAVGLGILLAEGLGDTIRVSLTTHPVAEVEAGYEILKALNLREHGPILVSCPSCGRAEADIIGLTTQVEARLREVKTPIKVAVMGCVVNGPGEAREADVGLACGKGKGIIFRKGQRIKVVPEAKYLDALFAEIDRWLLEKA